MQLTILTADDRTFFMEVDATMQLGDVLALVAAEAEHDPESIALVYNGQMMQDREKALKEYGMTSNEEAVQMIK